MDNDIFSGNGEKYCSLVVIAIIFLCFNVKVQFLTYETTTTMTFKLTTGQTMTTYLGQYNFEPYLNHTRVNDISRKWEKWSHICVTLIAYILCNDK